MEAAELPKIPVTNHQALIFITNAAETSNHATKRIITPMRTQLSTMPSKLVIILLLIFSHS